MADYTLRALNKGRAVTDIKGQGGAPIVVEGDSGAGPGSVSIEIPIKFPPNCLDPASTLLFVDMADLLCIPVGDDGENVDYSWDIGQFTQDDDTGYVTVVLLNYTSVAQGETGSFLVSVNRYDT